MVIFNFFKQAQRIHICNDFFTGIKTIHALISLGRFFINACFLVKNIYFFQLMPFAYLIIIKIMRRGNFYAAAAKFLIHISVRNNRDIALTKRQANKFSN